MNHVSANQIKKVQSCERLIAWEYNQEIKADETIKQSFGTNVHYHLEKWLRDGVAPNLGEAGLVAAQGIRHGWLPTPNKTLLVEHEFKLPLMSGLEITGRIDCVVPPDLTSPPLVIDHKTTSSLQWAMTPDELRADIQSIIYAAWAALEFNRPEIKMRWIYYSASNPKTGKRKPTGAKPVEIIHDVTSDIFLTSWDGICEKIKRIQEIKTNKTQALDLPPTPEACSAYGGCYYQNYCALSGLDKLAAAIQKEENKK